MGWVGTWAQRAGMREKRNGIYYYLHDDGNTYDYCYDENKRETTGWFRSEKNAITAAVEYYKKYGLVYPYGKAPPPIKSELMEF